MLLLQIFELQETLGMSDGQLLDCARWVNSCPDLRSIDELVSVELQDLQDELLHILYERKQNPLTAA